MRLVLALGGGTFAQPRNTALIREFGAAQRGAGAAVIWLDCATEDLLQRCVLMGDRPLFRDEASFRKLYEERLPYYRQADYRVESGGEPMRVVEQILALGIFDRSRMIKACGTFFQGLMRLMMKVDMTIDRKNRKLFFAALLTASLAAGILRPSCRFGLAAARRLPLQYLPACHPCFLADKGKFRITDQTASRWAARTFEISHVRRRLDCAQLDERACARRPG